MADGVRTQKRKRNMSLQYSVIAIIVLAIFAVLSMTVLFNIETADIIGSSIYSAEEIISASGINGGDNMIRKNLRKSARSIPEQLIYIETAEISRKLPSSVEIAVTPCIETASLENEDGFMIVSETGKILRLSEEPAEGTQIYYGADPAEELEIGMTFASLDENKTEVIFALMERGESGFAEKITSYDVRDRLNISCMYEDRIEIEIGVITDIDYKFRMADEIISRKLADDAEGRLKMLESGAQFLSKADMEQNDEIYERNIETNTEISTETLPEESVSETAAGTASETSLPAETESEMSTKLNFE